jgi:hypothetical protein
VPLRVDNAVLGIHLGDIVAFPDLGCEAGVAEIAPGPTSKGIVQKPDGTSGSLAFQGGALRLDAVPSCLAAIASGGYENVQVTILAQDVVVWSSVYGYVGRAPISTSTNPSDGYFALAWKDESKLSGEELAIAQRARRIFYPTEGPCPLAGATAGSTSALPVGCYLAFPRIADPLSPGPSIRFRLGLRNVTTAAISTSATDRPPRGAAIIIATQSGLTQTARIPTAGGTPPAPVIAVDPGDFSGHESEDFRFYLAYQDDQVAWFWTTSTTSQVTSIR